jgi:hypothetical protein
MVNMASHERISSEEKSDDDRQADTVERGGKDGGPPTPVGFWNSKLKAVRHEAFKKWLLTSVCKSAKYGTNDV